MRYYMIFNIWYIIYIICIYIVYIWGHLTNKQYSGYQIVFLFWTLQMPLSQPFVTQLICKISARLPVGSNITEDLFFWLKVMRRIMFYIRNYRIKMFVLTFLIAHSITHHSGELVTESALPVEGGRAGLYSFAEVAGGGKGGNQTYLCRRTWPGDGTAAYPHHPFKRPVSEPYVEHFWCRLCHWNEGTSRVSRWDEGTSRVSRWDEGTSRVSRWDEGTKHYPNHWQSIYPVQLLTNNVLSS